MCCDRHKLTYMQLAGGYCLYYNLAGAVLRVKLLQESKIACTCAGCFVYFEVNKRPYFSVPGPVPHLS